MAKPHVADPDIETLQEDDVEERTDLPWKVILFNDDVHTFEEVVIQLMKATGCGEVAVGDVDNRVEAAEQIQ